MDEIKENIGIPEQKTSGTISPVGEQELSDNHLTPRQALFVIEYLKDLNATQAAIRAGYSEATAAEQGSRLLTNVKISKAIDIQMKARARRTLITADRILSDMDAIAQRCMQAEPVMVFNKIRGEWEQLKDIEDHPVYQFDSAGANKALENLARNQKLLTDKLDMGNADGSNFNFPIIKEIFVASPEAAVIEQESPQNDEK